MKLPKELTTVTPLSKGLAMFLFIALPFVGFYLGMQYSLFLAPLYQPQSMATSQSTVGLDSKSVASSSPTPTIVSFSSLTADKDWSLYTTSTYSIQYPSVWQIKTNPELVGFVELYDQTSLQKSAGNGGSINETPTEYVYIQTIDTTQSLSQFVTQRTIDNPAYNGIKPEIDSIAVNGRAGEIFKASGEGSMGYDLIVSNGKEVVIFNVPTNQPTSDMTINKMFSTFQFIS